MLKKLKCMEGTAATLASSKSQPLIKTEPIDYETLHLEAEQQTQVRAGNRNNINNRQRVGYCAATSASAITSATTSASLTTPRYQHAQMQTSASALTSATTSSSLITPRYQHVQIQTVAPRQPSMLSNTACPSATATQKVILTPRLEYMQHNQDATNQYQPATQTPIIRRQTVNATTTSPTLIVGNGNAQQQQHVRVIRDGRLYEESSRRHSVSPPPLYHRNVLENVVGVMNTRSAPVSPINTASYVTQENDEFQQQQQQQHLVLNTKLDLYQGCNSSPPLATTATTQPRKYVITSTRHVNVISNNQQQHYQQQQQQHQQQQQQHVYNQQLQQQHHHHHQIQQQQQSKTPMTSTAITTTTVPSTSSHIFRTPVVSSSSSTVRSATTSTNNNNNAHTAMRPPPPPPPPKVKNSLLHGTCLGGLPSRDRERETRDTNYDRGSCEEPSSSIPDLGE